LRLPDRSQLSCGPPPYLLQAIDGLLAKERHTVDRMREHFEKCHGGLPHEVWNLSKVDVAAQEAADFAAVAKSGEKLSLSMSIADAPAQPRIDTAKDATRRRT
jgi:hypothetical protein